MYSIAMRCARRRVQEVISREGGSRIASGGDRIVEVDTALDFAGHEVENAVFTVPSGVVLELVVVVEVRVECHPLDDSKCGVCVVY